MPKGRPKGSKNNTGHRAGEREDDEDDEEGDRGSTSRRRGVSPSSPLRRSSESVAVSDRTSSSSRPIKPLHPLFAKTQQPASDENPSSPLTPCLPSLPHFSVVIPEDEPAESDPTPSGLLGAAETETPSSAAPDHGGSDTDDLEPEKEPEPTGIVQAYLLQTMLEIKDVQLPKHAQPDCYRVGKTFWITPPDRYFALQEYKSTAKKLAPDCLYYPRIFVWLPKSLLPKDFEFQCIFCASSKMSEHGWNHNPVARRVVDLDSCYYILSKRIKCDSCKKSCSLYEDKILAQLPQDLANEFPAFLTHRSGIDKTLVTLIRSGIAQGTTAHGWERILRELHVRNRDLAEQEYLHALKNCPVSQLPAPLVPFSSFGDKEAYAGFAPSRWYINSVYTDYMSYVKPHEDQAMSAIPASATLTCQSPPYSRPMGTYRDRGGTEGDGHSKGGGHIERRCRDRETVGTGARYRRGGGTGGQIGLVAPRAHTHGVGTRGTQLRWGDRGTCYGTSTVGGTLRGTSRAWYIHGGGTRGTNWTCSTSGAHTRCGDKGDTAAVGGQGDMLRNIDSGRDVKRDITCLVHTRWRDKGDISLQLLASVGIASRAWYIHGGGTSGTIFLHGCGDAIMCKVHMRWWGQAGQFFYSDQCKSGLGRHVDVFMHIGGGGTRGTFLVTLAV
ncbi:hypothetical protein B0H16DRAFT_1693088 [Mycena metata]|uniref:DUF6729 domain-containing protein n=1 Tax=Mycena metata TaxID=1033252 RepID=A0AAD7ILD9_9AGAR|nr:hypothetical protein B0H16DRAFT_1693088 [Mycena metata]